MTAFPVEDPDPKAVAFLLVWLLQFVRNGDGTKAYTQDAMAEACGLSRGKFKRFLALNLSDAELKERAVSISLKLLPVLDQARPFDEAFWPLYEQVYEGGERLQLDDNKPIKSPEVLRHLAMAKVDINAAPLEALYGLSVLVRPANDLLPRTAEDEPEEVNGWSVSVLTVPPPTLQEGLNHPVFRLRQRARNLTYTSVEGVIVTRDDRFVFQGIDASRKLPFNATLRLPEDMIHYRTPRDGKPPVMAKGVMLGLRSSGEAFGSFFELFAIPKGVLAEDADQLAKEAFSARYAKSMEAVGVENLEETLRKLVTLGVGEEEWLRLRLREMRDSARNATILSAF